MARQDKMVQREADEASTGQQLERRELVDELIRARQFLTTTAQTDTALYRFIEHALSSMDLPELRHAVEWATRLGWP